MSGRQIVRDGRKKGEGGMFGVEGPSGSDRSGWVVVMIAMSRGRCDMTMAWVLIG